MMCVLGHNGQILRLNGIKLPGFAPGTPGIVFGSKISNLHKNPLQKLWLNGKGIGP